MESIAVITSGFLPVPATKGGAVENLLQNAINQNETMNSFKLNIFTVFDEKAKEESSKYNNTDFIFIRIPRIVKLIDKAVFFIAKNILKKTNAHSYRFIFQRLWFLNKTSIYLKKNDYDKVLLENHPTQYFALKWRKNYLKYENRYYYHCHNEFPSKYGCEEIIKKTKRIICVSEYIAKVTQKYMDMPKQKFCVLRNGVDIKKFSKELTDKENKDLRQQHGINENDIVLLFTGRIVPEKGVLELVSAFNNINNKKVKLVILGAALNTIKDITQYQKQINEISKNNKNIIYTGFVDYNKIYQYYKFADIAVLPSIWDDPAPLTIIESIVCNLPIITTNSGGIPEYADNKCAVIIDRDDDLIKNLTTEIDNLINDENKRNNMKESSKEKAEELSAENYFKNFIEVMK